MYLWRRVHVPRQRARMRMGGVWSCGPHALDHARLIKISASRFKLSGLAKLAPSPRDQEDVAQHIDSRQKREAGNVPAREAVPEIHHSVGDVDCLRTSHAGSTRGNAGVRVARVPSAGARTLMRNKISRWVLSISLFLLCVFLAASPAILLEMEKRFIHRSHQFTASRFRPTSLI